MINLIKLANNNIITKTNNNSVAKTTYIYTRIQIKNAVFTIYLLKSYLLNENF